MKHAIIQHKNAPIYRSRQRGASLLEGIAYLGIAAIVILGAVSLLSSAFSSAQSNSATEEIISIRTAIRKLHAGQSYPAAITPIMIASKALPGSLNVNAAAGTATNSFGGAVTLTGAAGGGSFTIQYNSVPQDVCISVVSGASGWIQIDRAGQNAATTFPVPAATASAMCVAGPNTLNFTSA